MKKNIVGNLTVEAAFIMPMVLFSLFALLYLSFYLHDRCVIQGKVDKVLHKAGLTVKHEADISTGEVYYEDINNRGVFYLPFGSTKAEEGNILCYLQKELERGLFLAKVNDIQVAVDKSNISISVEAEITISLPGVKTIWKPYYYILVEERGQVHNPAEAIRVAEVVLDTGEKIRGVKALKAKFEEILN